ncbi:MAG: flagellar export chaperone FliS [Telluria sp.]|nr:flagellar export chaperone FliS [Telluria sp.]
MFGSSKSGANAYAKVGLETGVVAASPHKLIVMLFEGAMTSVTAAIGHMQAGETAKKGMAISKAIMIIENGMRASLDNKAGGEIASSLDALYDYMGRRLMMANLSNKVEMLQEVHGLLAELKSAWDAIGDKVDAPANIPAPRATAYDGLSPRSASFVSA